MELSGNVIDGVRLAATQDRMFKYAIILPDLGTESGAPWERVPDLRTLDSIDVPEVSFLQASELQRLRDPEALRQLQARSLPVRQILRASQTHTSWLGYEAVDIVVVGFGVLERIRQEHPERFQALRDWVGCGGAVWTYGVENRQTLAALFDAPPHVPASSVLAQDIRVGTQSFEPLKAIPVFDWSIQQLRDQNWSVEDELYMGKDPAERWEALRSAGHPAAERLSAAEMEQSIFAQPVLAGIVVGITDPDPFPGSFQLWHVAKHLTGGRQVWQLKHGAPVVAGTENFWDWTLVNVARPPVYGFLGVLTGFVLLVGPVSYHLTRRRGRTYLMFFIAPVLATVATSMLFGYSVLADGLGTQVRVRQITWIDGASGHAARLTRATYFAGFRPDEGLKFPLDAAVYPIRDGEDGMDHSQHGGPLRIDRQVVIDDHHQRFSGDYLPSRRQRQFASTRPLDQAGSISLQQAAGQPPQLRNDLDLEMSQLLVRNADGDYFMTAGPLAVGKEAAVSAIAATQVPGLLRDLYQVESLDPPPGYSPSHSTGWFGRSYYQRMGFGQQQFHSRSWYHNSLEHGVFESRLGMMLQEEGEIPPGWFVGLAALSADAIAVEGATPVSSVHFVMGALR